MLTEGVVDVRAEFFGSCTVEKSYVDAGYFVLARQESKGLFSTHKRAEFFGSVTFENSY